MKESILTLLLILAYLVLIFSVAIFSISLLFCYMTFSDFKANNSFNVANVFPSLSILSVTVVSLGAIILVMCKIKGSRFLACILLSLLCSYGTIGAIQSGIHYNSSQSFFTKSDYFNMATMYGVVAFIAIIGTVVTGSKMFKRK